MQPARTTIRPISSSNASFNPSTRPEVAPAHRASPTASMPANILLTVGALAALSLSALHPPGPDAATMAETGASWFLMHLTGGIGFLLFGAAALLLLVSGRRSAAATTGLVFMTLGGIFTAIAFSIDGSIGTALAPSVAVSGPTPLWDLMYHFERAFMTLGLGSFSIGGAIFMATLARSASTSMRVVTAFGLIGTAAMFGAGVLFVGFKVPVGPLFALMPLTFVWLAFIGVRGLIGRSDLVARARNVVAQ